MAAHGEVGAAQHAGAGPVGPGQRHGAEPARDLRPGRAGVRVHVRPVPQEEQPAVLERLPRLLLLVAERLARDPAVAHPVREEPQSGARRVGVHRHARAVVAQDRTARRLHGLGDVDGEAFVGQELAGVAVQSVLRGDRACLADQLGPGARWLLAFLLQDVLPVVEQPRVRDVRDRVQPAVEGRGVDDRPQEGVQGEAVALERGDPSGRRELGRPGDVDVQHVEPVAARPQFADHLGPGLVRRIGQLDERDALVGMAVVPVVEQRGEVVGQIPRRHERQGTAPVRGRARVGARTETGVPRQHHRPDQESSTRGTHPPHRFLPVHDPAALPTIGGLYIPVRHGRY